MESLCRSLPVIVVALSLPGCSGEGPQTTYQVTGTVTMVGAPVADAMVVFVGDDKQPAATGRTDSTGKYTLTTYEAGDGAVEGKYVAIVIKADAAKNEEMSEDEAHAAVVSGAAAPDDGHAADGEDETASSGSLLPEKYASKALSDLNVTVESSDDNVIDLKLEP